MRKKMRMRPASLRRNSSGTRDRKDGGKKEQMTIQIEYEAEREWEIDYRPIIEEIVVAALDYEKCPYEMEVNVVLTNDEEIRHVAGIRIPTGQPTSSLFRWVITMCRPILNGWKSSQRTIFNRETGELLLGDIVISIDKVDEQAEKYGHSKERELAFLVAHSMLHLCGYDHMEDDERLVMEKKQEEILAGKEIYALKAEKRTEGKGRALGNEIWGCDGGSAE
ncbi:MAG: rRNA maturation RNase YbeY [Clostridium fessum]